LDKYAILLGYFDKQWSFIEKMQQQIVSIHLSSYESRYVFALKTQQFYTAIEDLLKQVAKSFENHIENLSEFHKGLLLRLQTDIPSIRPKLLSDSSFRLLDKIRAFRHFVRHAYDCELQEKELKQLQQQLAQGYQTLEKDFSAFRHFVQELTFS